MTPSASALQVSAKLRALSARRIAEGRDQLTDAVKIQLEHTREFPVAESQIRELSRDRA
jgi:hypothetical protein